MTGLDQLDDMIARVASLDGFTRAVAPDIATAIEAEIHKTIAAGTSSDGVAWAPTKTGEQPLRHAADAVAVVAVGTTVFVRVRGPEARHHLGRGRGGLARPIIPVGEISPRMAAAVQGVLAQRFQEVTSG
jgi:hypothetical protein